MRGLKQETSLFVGVLVFMKLEILCSVQLSIKKVLQPRGLVSVLHPFLCLVRQGSEIYLDMQNPL